MVFSKFESFPARPPTPPKDLKEVDTEVADTLEFLQDPFGTKKSHTALPAAKSLLSTPQPSPSSDIGDISSSRRKKRVNFELQACAEPSSTFTPTQWTPLHSSPLRPLPQTRVARPLRPILKASDQTATPPPADDILHPHNHKTFGEMLESIVKMLAQGVRPSKLDAYIQIQRTMQAYDKVPETHSLVNKMGLLSQFIRRDMQAVGINGTGPDSQLVGQALKFLMALVRIPELRSAMDDDFCAFVIDRSITVITDPNMPKAIINTHLALLMQQSFKHKIMTASRVERILDALDSIHERVSGFSVQAYRIRVYRKLIQQRADVMTKHFERWFKHVIKAMLSNSKDIHQSALDTAMCAVKSIGTTESVTKSVLSIMNRVKNDGNTFGSLFAQQLEKSLSSDNAPLVPQIWATMTAFLRHSLDGEKFAAMGDWFRVMERFSLIEDELVKPQANLAINFLTYAVDISQQTSEPWTKLFVDFFHHRFSLRTAGRKNDIDTATSAYLTLLYYALRPAAPHAQLSRFWNLFVAEFWNSLIRSSPAKHAIVACRIMSALFNGSRRPWNEQRALELKPSLAIQRSELPLLDPRWVRKSLVTILQFGETLLDAAPWNVAALDDEPVKTMWLSLLSSLVEAGSKEVMASSESKDAMAHIVNMLRRMWDSHTAKLADHQEKEDIWADKYCFLLDTIIQKLGALRFTDKSLIRNAKDEFEVASTPSHRARQQGARVSPLLYFLDLFGNRSEGKLSDSVRIRVIQHILEPCLEAQNTRLAKLELLRDCGTVAEAPGRTSVLSTFWDQIGKAVRVRLQDTTSDSNERASRQLGKEYDTVVEIIALGSTYLLDSLVGYELLASFIDTVRQEAGEGALIIAVIEKLSDNVLNKVPSEDCKMCLPFASLLLAELPSKVARRTLEQGRSALYPSSHAPNRTQEFDPYNHLYTVVVKLADAAYEGYVPSNTEVTSLFVKSLAKSIRQCPPSLAAAYMRKTQACIAVWVQDADRKLNGNQDHLKQLRKEVTNLWQAVIETIQKLPKRDSTLLSSLEPLLTAGFSSQRRSIVNASIDMWNATFGQEQNLRYPAGLLRSLRRLQRVAEVSLPNFDDTSEDLGPSPSFYDSDTSIATPDRRPLPTQKQNTPNRSVKALHGRAPRVPTPASSKRSSRRRTPKVRLRHEDSQLHFEPIVSSPAHLHHQESQILTERQQEMIERQQIASKLYPDLGSRADHEHDGNLADSHHEMHSDAVSVEGPPSEAARTPSKTLAALGPMDAYLGSSPTPHSRRHSRRLRSDATTIVTPTALRAVSAAAEPVELGSSPPQFEKSQLSVAARHPSDQTSDDFPSESVSDSQAAQRLSSFDGGITVDDERDDTEAPGISHSEIESVDMPSSTIEFQLDAQLDAEMQAQVASSQIDQTTAQRDAPDESVAPYVDALSQLSPAFEGVNEAREASLPQSANDTSSISRVRDSFSEPQQSDDIPAASQTGSQGRRRSARHSKGGTPAPMSSAKKRKQTRTSSRTRSKKMKKTDVDSAESQAVPEPVSEQDTVLDCIEVPSPTPNKAPSPASPVPAPTTTKRKTRRSSQMIAETPAAIPTSSTRKRTTRLSSSFTGGGEVNVGETQVEESPAPKRARQKAKQDVSTAKVTPTREIEATEEGSQAKRLSHVQVTPKTGSRASSVAAEVPEESTQPSSTKEAEAPPQVNAAPSSQAPTQSTSAATETPNRSFAERVILTPMSVLSKLRKLMKDASQMVLGREEQRQFDDALFDFRVAVHDAGRRGEPGQE